MVVSPYKSLVFTDAATPRKFRGQGVSESGSSVGPRSLRNLCPRNFHVYVDVAANLLGGFCVVSDSHLQEIKRDGSRYALSHIALRVSDVFHRALAELRPRTH
jgi:hypothetical protein